MFESMNSISLERDIYSTNAFEEFAVQWETTPNKQLKSYNYDHGIKY